MRKAEDPSLAIEAVLRIARTSEMTSAASEMTSAATDEEQSVSLCDASSLLEQTTETLRKHSPEIRSDGATSRISAEPQRNRLALLQYKCQRQCGIAPEK